MSGESPFGYLSKGPKPVFIVRNITHLKGEPKVIKIFNYPINPELPSKGIQAGERDLLQIPGIGVDSIETSLMSGILKSKILAKEIKIIKSSIELLQFDQQFLNFIKDAGATEGVELPDFNNSEFVLTYLWRKSQKLIGIKNNINKIFYTSEPFLNGLTPSNDALYIEIFHNGRRLIENINYTIGKSTPSLDGYDTITFTNITPSESSELEANYAIKA